MVSTVSPARQRSGTPGRRHIGRPRLPRCDARPAEQPVPRPARQAPQPAQVNAGQHSPGLEHPPAHQHRIHVRRGRASTAAATGWFSGVRLGPGRSRMMSASLPGVIDPVTLSIPNDAAPSSVPKPSTSAVVSCCRWPGTRGPCAAPAAKLTCCGAGGRFPAGGPGRTSGNDAGALTGYRGLVAASRAVCTTVAMSSRKLELMTTTTGIVPARTPKKT